MNNRAKLPDIFQLLKHKPLREDNPLQPFKIVSLWDMLRFHAEKFVQLCSALTGLSEYIAQQKKQGKLDQLSPVSPERNKAWRDLTKMLEDVNLTMSAASAKRLGDLLHADKEIDAEQLKSLVDHLNFTVTDELQQHLFVMVPVNHAQFYDKKGTILGKELIGNFQELTRDAAEAGNCYALGRYTACVFHLSRLLEGSIQKLATELGATKEGQPLDVKNEDWFQIEVSIGKVINNWPKGEKKTKYSKVLSSLSALRGGWRNTTMHPGDGYSDEEAEALIKFTKQFLNDFSKLPPP
jgi:hypothetical protein